MPALRFRFHWFVLILIAGPLQAQEETVYEEEVRGVWITNVDSNVMFSKEALADAMDYLAANGINVVFPVVWNKGYTMYPSEVMAQTFGEGFRQDVAFNGRDPLAEILVEAHRVGLEVIPWFEFGFSTSFSQNGGHILAAKPHWATKNTSGDLVVKNGFDWMNGIHPEVQDFMLGLMKEVVTNYDVDGVQGDDRLPAMPIEAGYSDYTKQLYRDEHGGQDPPTNFRQFAWQQWRADKLTAFAGRVFREIKALKPYAIISFSPSNYPFSFNEYLQDWPRWLDSSYVEMVHPQAYPPPPRSVGQYRNIITSLVGSTPGSELGYIDPEHHHKIMPGMLVKAGSDLVDPQRVLDMMAIHRGVELPGEVFFFYEGMREKNDFLADTLFQYYYGTPAILPMRNDLWRPPATIVLNNDAAVSTTGTWTEDPGAPGFDGNMLVAEDGSGSTVTYTLTAPYTGTYDLFTYLPRFEAAATDNAYYEVDDGTEKTVYRYSQRRTTVLGWMPLGAVTLNEGAAVTLTLAADSVTDGRSTFADAAMLILNRAATPDLVIDIRTTDVEADPAEGTLPMRPALHANYPNPFNPTTTLAFSLPRAEPVRLSVYDVLGRRVATLIDGTHHAAGRHEIAFDATALSSGIYFYRLETTAGPTTRQMLLVK